MSLPSVLLPLSITRVGTLNPHRYGNSLRLLQWYPYTVQVSILRVPSRFAF